MRATRLCTGDTILACAGTARGAGSQRFLVALNKLCLKADKTLSLGRSLSHHGSLALAYYLACEVHYLRRDAAALSSLADEMLPFVTDHGSPLSVANATIFQGWALIANGATRMASHVCGPG